MTAPLHTRPFCLEHAKAGAPFCCRNGQEVTMLKWDARYPGHPLLGTYGSDDNAMGWKSNGSANYGESLDLVMTPLGMLDGKPVFVGDEVLLGDEFLKANPTWKECDMADCRWPAPAPVYPETRMTAAELASNRYGSLPIGAKISESYEREARAIANAALRHAIDAGQVVDKKTAVACVDVAESLANRAANDRDRAERTLQLAGYTDLGGDLWQPPLAVTKEAYDQCSRDLGVAEQLLEEMNWRLIDGRWQYAGAGLDPHSVSARKGRDMAIAVAVSQAEMSRVIGSRVDLAAIVAGVKS